jgi:hypothetical protein
MDELLGLGLAGDGWAELGVAGGLEDSPSFERNFDVWGANLKICTVSVRLLIHKRVEVALNDMQYTCVGIEPLRK